MNTARHQLVSCRRRSTTCEALESRQLLSAGDIDLADLIARSAAPSTQTNNIVDSAGNRYEFWSTPGVQTYLSKISPVGDVLWTTQFRDCVSIEDTVLTPSESTLWMVGAWHNSAGFSGMSVWHLDVAKGGPLSRWDYQQYPEVVNDLAIDSGGYAVVAGQNSVLRVGPSGLMWKTQIHRSSDAHLYAIALVSWWGEIVIGGVTTATDLEGARYGTPGGSGVFLSRLYGSGQMIASAYLNGSTPEQLQAFLGVPSIQGTELADTILVSRTTVNVGAEVFPAVQVTVNGIPHLLSVRPRSVTIRGMGGNDTIAVNSNVTIRAVIYGGEGDDTLTASAINSSLYGGSGNDLLNGRAGNDLIEGGEGADTLIGDDGNDTLYGHDGNDLIDAGAGDDELYGNNGTDRLLGRYGNDYVAGQEGDDHIFGGHGNDKITGGDGDDMIAAGRGTDTVYGNFGSDLLYGDDDNDQIFGGRGLDSIAGHDGDDTLRGGDGTDLIYGGPGDDQIEGKGKADTLRGGIGNDTILGGAGADFIFGEDGDDTLDANPHARFRDTISGGAGHDLYRADSDDLLMAVEDVLV